MIEMSNGSDAFKRFTDRFQIIELFDPNSEEGMMEPATHDFEEEEFTDLRRYLVKILSEKNDEELSEIWNRSNANYFITPIRKYYESVVKYIDKKIEK
jgi:hypothetical protein